MPPVRNRVDIAKSLEKGAAAASKKSETTSKGKGDSEVYKRDVTKMKDYYKAWDNYDIDKALESSDEEDGGKKVGKIKYKEPAPV